MPRRIAIVHFALCLLFSAPFFSHASDLLIHNVNGYTFTQGSEAIARFDQLLIRNGKVVSTDPAVINDQVNDQTPRLNGRGKTLLPGLIDAHGHLEALGSLIETVDLRASQSAQAAASAVAAFSDKNPDAQVILGRGWNQENWPDQRFPEASVLDSLNLDKPIVLSRVDGHALWVNSVALTLAGITADTADPEGGQIVRDPSGKATGILVDTAMDLVNDKLPGADNQVLDRQLSLAYQHLLSLGVTGVHDAGVEPQTERMLRQHAKAGTLPIRVYAMLKGSDPGLAARLKKGKVRGDFLRVQSVKIYADGALGSRGATLISDYADETGNKGLAITGPDALKRQFQMVQKHGFQIAVHAIGDQANRDVLNTFATLASPRALAKHRHRVEHAQVIAPEDLSRFASLNIIASMQPTHATSDRVMAIKRLGDNRLNGAYAWSSLLASGARMAFGSDFPVEPANPFYGIHAAVTRQDRDNQPVDGWRMQDAVDVATALRLFTRDAAYAAHWEKDTGTLEPGKWADFILIDTNPFTTLPDYLWQIQVEQTWVAGEPVWQK